ncbi:MAG: hypothetical protein KGR26_14215, partial [Cyanobacteria bacterium REEB65]|nr:hypothetical protein [Cyanobacteria bacterium REEB65]
GSQLYLNAKPTIDGGGQLIILSTANGIGGLFHGLWKKAVAGTNSFKTIFLPWWARPGRDRAFYERQLADSTDPATVPQNYPANALEAFLVSGRVRFPSAWVLAQQKHVQDAIARDQWPDALQKPANVRGTIAHLPGIKLYKLPEVGRRYVVSADVAEGKETGDYDAGVVIDAKTWEEVATIHGHWEPDEYADMLAVLGYLYNGAEIIVERNNHGHAVLTALKLKQYPWVGDGHDGDPGWLTNKQTKPESIDLLAECLRDELITVRTAAALQEMHTYRVIRGGKTEAEEGSHDDYVMAWAIALAFVRLRSVNNAGAPATGGAIRTASMASKLSRPPGLITPQLG